MNNISFYILFIIGIFFSITLGALTWDEKNIANAICSPYQMITYRRMNGKMIVVCQQENGYIVRTEK